MRPRSLQEHFYTNPLPADAAARASELRAAEQQAGQAAAAQTAAARGQQSELFDRTTQDVVAADALLQDIARAREAGAAVVFSTHVLREAERLCDRIAVIEGGRIRAIGTLPALLTQTGCDDLEGAFLALVRRE